MIKVLNIISDSNIGGAGKCVITFCKNYDKSKYDVSVVVPSESKLIPELQKIGINIIEVDGLKDKSLDLKAFFKLRKIIKEQKPDIVHTHASSIARLAARFVKGTRIIYTRHSVFPVSEKIKHGIGRFIYKNSNEFLADRIIAVAEAAKENLTDGGIDENLIDVVLNGVDKISETSNEEKDSLKKKYGIKQDEKVIGILARLEKVKGHEFFIDMAKEVLDAGIKAKFLILGTGSEEDNLKQKVKELKLGDSIIFTGFIQNVKDFVNIFDLQINCSYGTEATSLALLEGMSIGVPAIVTEYGGNPGVIKNGENGYLVPIKDSHAMAQKVIKVLKDDALYEVLKENSIKIFNERFTSKVYTKNIEGVYDKVMSKEKEVKINPIDFVIVLIVVVAGLVGYRFLRKTDVIVPNTVKVTYKVRSNDVMPEVAEMINKDTELFDSIKNYHIGKVIDKEVTPAQKAVFDQHSQKYNVVDIKDEINIILTVEADAVVEGKDIVLDNAYALKIGNQAFVKGKGYAYAGYIVAIDRLDEEQ